MNVDRISFSLLVCSTNVTIQKVLTNVMVSEKPLVFLAMTSSVFFRHEFRSTILSRNPKNEYIDRTSIHCRDIRLQRNVYSHFVESSTRKYIDRTLCKKSSVIYNPVDR